MYSVILAVAFTAAPEIPDCNRAARVSARHAVAQGCTSAVAYVPVAVAQGCSGSAHAFRTPLRSSLHRVTAPRGVTTFYPASAVAIVAPAVKPVQQSAAPPLAVAPIAFAAPVFRTPVRSAVYCPNGRCPK